LQDHYRIYRIATIVYLSPVKFERIAAS